MYILCVYNYLIFPYVQKSLCTENVTPISNALTLQLCKPVRKDQ